MAWNADGASFAKIEFPKLSLIESLIHLWIKYGFISFSVLCASHMSFSERIRDLVYSDSRDIKSVQAKRGKRR